jgi:ornithine decarboxylase
MNLFASEVPLHHFATIEQLIETLRPGEPVYALFPEKFRIAAHRFLHPFPGDTLYAVKANPAPAVLDLVYAAGIRHFDTASLPEIELVRRRFPDAICHFMAPVRVPGSAHVAYSKHGIRDFVVDCDFELDKLLAETEGGRDCRIFVRLATPSGGAVFDLSGKFGTTCEDAAQLLSRINKAGAAPALTFHVGSQCLTPLSYARAIALALRTVTLGAIEIAALDLGGGFPVPYPSQDMPPYSDYFREIREAVAMLPNASCLSLLCEPGRALVAEGVSLVAQVVLRKGDNLYLNDGIYGSFDELTISGSTTEYPTSVLTLNKKGRADLKSDAGTEFNIYGPTCDTLDTFPRPLRLPDSIAPGDYIVFDTIGAYSYAVRTNFNGFLPDRFAIIGG